MALTKIERSPPMYKFKHSSLLNIIDSFLLCFLPALVCSLFFSTFFWIPFLQASSTRLFLLLSALSEATDSIFPSPKCVFIVGNLIVVLLVGESKIFSSETSDRDRTANDVFLYDGSFVLKSVNFGDSSIGEREDDEQGDDEWEMSLASEELSKRADDFIARVNMQRKFEAMVLPYCCEWTTMKKKYRKRNCLKERLSLCNYH